MNNKPERILIRDQAFKEISKHRLYVRAIKPLVKGPLDGRAPELTLKRGSAILESIKQKQEDLLWWIGVGTALGYSRDNNFIPGDTDIDVRIALDYRDEVKALKFAEKIVEIMQAEGFRLIREMYWDRRPMQTAFYDTRNNNIIFDIYYFYSSYTKDCYVNVNAQGYREKPAYLLKDLKKGFWPGHEDIVVYTPSPVEEYNVWRWGPEWRIPKKNSELDKNLDLKCIKKLPTEYVTLAYGSFDVFHAGHIRLLERAASLGDKLIVGVVSDELLYLKGKKNVTTEEQRVEIISALKCVDQVFIQTELDQKEKDIERFEVKYMVFGEDWTAHPRVEAVRGYRGLEIVYMSRTVGVSSSRLKKRLINNSISQKFETLQSYLSTLDAKDTYVVREIGDHQINIDSSIKNRISNYDKLTYFYDKYLQKQFSIGFVLACNSQITIDLNNRLVYKDTSSMSSYNIFQRERHWLKKFHGCPFIPELVSDDGDHIVTRYLGEPVRQYNIPNDWREQAEDILHHLARKHCSHNDIKCDNLLVFNAQIYLIDFSWATCIGDAIPSHWPEGIGRQHRIDIHRFDDRKAIYEALESAENNQIDHSIKINTN